MTLNQSQTPYAVVIGGVNMDICGHCDTAVVPGDSMPGTVSYSPGGVGRNIAHNLSLMGTKVVMLTAYGDDANGARIAASCAQLNIDVSHALVVPGATSPTYLYITDREGEMLLAVNDMRVCDMISPEYLRANLDLINSAQLVICDTNIPAETLRFIAENVRVPIFCDPVSTVKAEKLRGILGRLHTFKPNRVEAEHLTGIAITDVESAKRAARELLKTGTQRVFISMGSDGMIAVTREGDLHLSNLPARMVNTTGCGDAFMAGLAHAFLEGKDLLDSALTALAAASIAIESEKTISPEMSGEALRERVARAGNTPVSNQ